MDFRSHNKFWVMAGILGFRISLNIEHSGIDMLEIVHRSQHASLWECLEISGGSHAHSVGVSKGLIPKESMGPRHMIPEWLGWLAGVFLLMWRFYFRCLCRFHLLKVT